MPYSSPQDAWEIPLILQIWSYSSAPKRQDLLRVRISTQLCFGKRACKYPATTVRGHRGGKRTRGAFRQTEETYAGAVYDGIRKGKNHEISYKQAMWELDCCESTYYKMKKEFTKQSA